MKTLDGIREVFESNGIEMYEYVEDGVPCGYELNCYTNGGVNEIVFLDFRDKGLDPMEPQDVIEEFENCIRDYDIDDRIETNRYNKGYKQAFTISQSVKDFEEFEGFLKNILVQLHN